MVSYLNGCWPSMIMAIFINTLIPAFLIWFIESTGLSKNKQIFFVKKQLPYNRNIIKSKQK